LTAERVWEGSSDGRLSRFVVETCSDARDIDSVLAWS
jgi:hypothetical protein